MTALPILRTSAALLAVLVASTSGAAAQGSPAQSDSSRAQIHTGLRAFYFNLAHRDWDALTAEILPAKIVAHRPVPEVLVRAADLPDRATGLSATADGPVACSPTPTPLLDQATITLDGDWAEVTVPRCAAPLAGTDEFRLIRFERRWRFVFIHLFEEPVTVSTDR
jgi:hypothetical protein